MRLPLLLVSCMVLFPAATGDCESGEDGVGEFSLDSKAVTALVRAGMPETIMVPVPAIGKVALSLEPPDRVTYNQGGIEATVRFLFSDLKLAGALRLRYVPFVDNEQGIAGLQADYVVPQEPVSIPIDLAPFLPRVDLSRQMLWRVGGTADEPRSVAVGLRKIIVTDDRLTLQFRLSPDH